MNNWMKTAQFIHVRSAVHEYLREAEGLTLNSLLAGPGRRGVRAVRWRCAGHRMSRM